jgi:hypothetical protein
MRFEIVIIIITFLVIGNIYTDGKFLKMALSWTKYYKMIGVAIVGYMVIWMLRKIQSEQEILFIVQMSI